MRLAAALVPVLLAAPRATLADTPSDLPQPPERIVMRLDFHGVPGCSDPDPFVALLTPHVRGWDPLAPGGRWRLVLTVARRAPGYEGSAELHDPNGDIAWTRSFTAKPTCYALLDRLATATALRIDPPGAPPPPSPRCLSSPAPAPPPPPEPPTPPLFVEPATPPEPKTPLSFRFGTGLWADLISSDRGSVGLTLDAGVRYGWFSVAVEGRGDPPIGSTVHGNGLNGGSVSFARATGALVVCGHYDVLVGCVKGQAGRILFPGTFPPEPAALYAAAGIRVGVEYPVVPQRISVRLDGEVLAPIDPAFIEHQKQTVFQVDGWNAGIGIGALFALSRR